MDSSNSATFTIALSDTAENKITASAMDKVGNTMAPENYGSFANGAKLVHDITVPEIKADLAHFYVDTNMEGVTTSDEYNSPEEIFCPLYRYSIAGTKSLYHSSPLLL